MTILTWESVLHISTRSVHRLSTRRVLELSPRDIISLPWRSVLIHKKCAHATKKKCSLLVSKKRASLSPRSELGISWGNVLWRKNDISMWKKVSSTLKFFRRRLKHLEKCDCIWHWWLKMTVHMTLRGAPKFKWKKNFLGGYNIYNTWKFIGRTLGSLFRSKFMLNI